jgi:hypothetical protein
MALRKFLIALIVVGVASACGGSSSPTMPTGAEPTVSGLTPGLIVMSQSPQVITVAGTNFLAGLTVTLTDPTGVTSTFDGTAIHSLQAGAFQISPTLSMSGQYTLLVRNTTGETSQPFTFVVQGSANGSTTPHIDAVNPSAPVHSVAPQVLAINGSGFSQGVTVTVLDPMGQMANDVSVGAVSATSIQFSVTLGQTGIYTVSVTSPTGQTSNSIVLNVL